MFSLFSSSFSSSLTKKTLLTSDEISSVAAWCRMDCRAFVVGIKCVIQPVCSHTHIQAVAGRCPHIRCDGMCGGLLEWSLKSSSHWHVEMLSTTFRCHWWQSMVSVTTLYWNLALLDCWDSPLHLHACMWTPLTVWDHQFECYWNLTMLDFRYRLIPAFKRHWRSSTAFDACEHVRRCQWARYINLVPLTVGLIVYTVKVATYSC